jgi:hypothetical protein
LNINLNNCPIMASTEKTPTGATKEAAKPENK